MFKLYGFDVSVPVNKVRYMANHSGLKYSYERLDPMLGDLQKEEHLHRHPAGKVPVIIDEGFVLFESNAIMKYLARKHRLTVYPDDLHQQALVDQWIDFVTIHINQAMNRVSWNRFFCKLVGSERDEQSLKDGLSFLERFLPVVNNQLDGRTGLTGDAITLADFNLVATMDPAELAEVDLSPYPHLKAYLERMIAQNFYQQCFEHYSDCFTDLK
jgi:glutathione S-transferase